jgi:NADPH-dependent ferric siderophore reductase
MAPQLQTKPDAPRPRTPRVISVLETEQLTPSMRRIVFGGDDLAGFELGPFTDSYVKLQVPPAGADYEAPFDLTELRARLPADQLPRTRTYTVRDWDPREQRLTIDFVVHGDEGIAGPWARAAQRGDTLQFLGPGGGYAPEPEADWHLFVGDLSVIPAIGASLPHIPAGHPVRVLIQLDHEEDIQAFDSPGQLEVTWLRGGDEEIVVNALRELDFPAGHFDAFVHGEASAVRAVRKHLLVERGLSPVLSASGYWKRTLTDEGWREAKREWNRLVEADTD